MKQQTISTNFLRQRKILVALPLLVLPFITFLFWSLGGGQESDAQTTSQGFNMALPDAYLKEDEPLDKLSFYNKADLDSAKLKELMKNDPNYTYDFGEPMTALDTSFPAFKKTANGSRLNTSPHSAGGHNDPNEEKVYNKLEQLNAALSRTSAISESNSADYTPYQRKENNSINNADVDRLENMMEVMNQKNEDDSEIHQLNSMMERILDIQHPERVQDKIRQTSEERKGQLFAVSSKGIDDHVSLLADDAGVYNDSGSNQQNGFYSLEDEKDTALQNAIQAVVHETQTLVQGSTVKLRLVHDVYINGNLIQEGNFLFGTASLNGERLNIKVNSIRYQNSLYPVDLSVYDIDGMDGIYIPGAITRDVAKQSTDRAVQNIGFATLDPSVGAQAASAGIEAAKSLLSKKVKLIKVTIKAGYQVLLLDEKQKQNN